MTIRKVPRFVTEVPVSARWTNGGMHEVSGQTRDVSSAGMFFYAEFAPENGSQIEVMVALPAEVTGLEAKSLLCRGRVVRVEAVEQEAALQPKYGVAVEIESYELIGES
jgi:PilZ domain